MSSDQPDRSGFGMSAGSTAKLVDHAPSASTRFPVSTLEALPSPSEEEDDYLPELFDQPDPGVAMEAAGGVAWAATDRLSPCYNHLIIGPGDNVAAPKTFEFGKLELEMLIAANRYLPRGEGDNIAFGLRGARLRGGEKAELVDRLSLEDVRPDHRNFRCVVGFYHRATGKLSAYTGSTVPWHSYMRSGATFNLLPTGCYIYKKGAHVGSNATVTPALRLSDAKGVHSGRVTVLRTRKDEVFDLDDVWDMCAPSDNVHCAFSNDKFSSLGCQTVKGTTNAGLWTDFQSTLEDLPDGARVDYLLFTGTECGIAAALVKASMSGNAVEIQRRLGRLRMGSEGEEVNRLQAKLGVEPTGYFGAQTKKSLTEAQPAAKVPVDGVYTPALDAKLGWTVLASPAPAAPAAASTSVPSVAPPPAAATAPASAPAPVPRPDPIPSPRPVSPTAAPAPAAAPAPPAASPEPSTPVPTTAPAPPSDAKSAPSPAPAAAIPKTATPAAAVPAAAPAKPAAPAEPEPAVKLTVDTLKAFAPKARPDYAAVLGTEGNAVLSRYGINESPLRFCHFMAQVGHECGGFTITTESLKYTAERMVEMFGPGRHSAKLTLAEARTLVGKEEAFAERIYGLGNPTMARSLGNTAPGDGYKYRGRGFIQLTGRSEYREVGRMIGIDLEAQPEKAAEPLPALMSAAALWDDRDLNAYADRNDIVLITKKINGGRNGLDDRQSRLTTAKRIWAARLESMGGGLESVSGSAILELGSLGPDVARLKQQLRQAGYGGFTANEDFDRPTHLAAVRFKLDHGLPGDGVIDQRTWSALERSSAMPRRPSVERPLQPAGFDPDALNRSAALARRVGSVRFWGGIMLFVAVVMTLIRLVHAGVPLDSGWQLRQFEFALIALIAIGGVAVMVLCRSILRACAAKSNVSLPPAHIPSAVRGQEVAEASDLDLGIRPAVNQ